MTVLFQAVTDQQKNLISHARLGKKVCFVLEACLIGKKEYILLDQASSGLVIIQTRGLESQVVKTKLSLCA